MEALFFITHSLHTYAHKSQLDLHVRLHSMTNSTTWIPFLLFECCELPLDAHWTACWALKEDALQAGFQAAPGSLLVTQWQQMCSSLKINRTFEEVLTRCANSDTQHSQSFSHQMKEDLCDQSHLFVIFFFFLMTFYSSAMSHFSNQSCWVSHMLLLWMWWEVSVRMAALCPQLERCPVRFLCPPSHLLHVSLPPVCLPSFADIACFTLSTTVRKEVCVFASAGICVGLLPMVCTGFRNFLETQMIHPLVSELWVAYLLFFQRILIYQQETFLSGTQRW